MRLLVIEDQTELREHLAAGLCAQGYHVQTAADGESGWSAIRDAGYDLIILDCMLPGIDGLEVLRRIRISGLRIPVLLLTARDSITDRVAGLDAGADDYLPKPFSVAELLARIRALLRRGKGGTGADPVMSIADLEVDRTTQVVRRGGRRIDLSSREYALLEYLLDHLDMPASREELFAALYAGETEEASNVINVLVGRLRKKIDLDGHRPLVHTRRGFGYVLSADPA